MPTHKNQYLKKKGLNPKESYSIDDLVKISGEKKSILQEVYNRGVGAWKTNPQSVRSKVNPTQKGVPLSQRMGKEQWGMARVYSFLNDGKTAKTADKDLKGSGIGDENTLQQAKSYSLSNSDLELLTNRTNIFTYPELENIRNIDEIFKKGKNGVGTAIILFLTDNERTGHWIALIKRGRTIEMYDPYGFKPEKLGDKLGGQMAQKQDPHLLRELVESNGYNFIHNSKQAQPLSQDINTCGRHSAMRIMFSHLPLDEYNKKIGDIARSSGVSMDDLATGLTAEILGK